MEYFILLGLTALIILISIRSGKGKPAVNKPSKTPATGRDILGPIKPLRPTVSNTALDGRDRPDPDGSTNFIQLNDEKDSTIEPPHDEPEDISQTSPDWDEEEEEFRRFILQGEPGGYATGVTFEELSAAQLVIGSESTETAMVQAAATVRKIVGTDLLTLLENALGESAQKLALLLASPEPSPDRSDITSLTNTEFDGFNIEEYL